MNEIWKPVIYQGKHFDRFEVSNQGNFRNAETKKVYALCTSHNGYKTVCVSLGSRKNKKVFKIHKAVAETFIANPENKPFVNHIDGNKINNCIDNLEWATGKENTEHAIRTGLMNVEGSANKSAKLTDEQVKYIRKNYIPKDKEFGCNALCEKLHIHRTTFSNVVHNRTYTNVV